MSVFAAIAPWIVWTRLPKLKTITWLMLILLGQPPEFLFVNLR